MRVKSLNIKLTGLSSIAIVASVTIVVAAVEIKALNAREPKVAPGATVNSAECVRCHSDEKSINIMRLKEDGSNYLFNSDGTFKDAKLNELTKNYKHKLGKDAAAKAW